MLVFLIILEYRPKVPQQNFASSLSDIWLQVTSSGPESIFFHPLPPPQPTILSSSHIVPSGAFSLLHYPNGSFIFSLHAARFVHQYSCFYCFMEFDFLLFSELLLDIWITTGDHDRNFKAARMSTIHILTFALRALT